MTETANTLPIVFLVDDEPDILRALQRELGRIKLQLYCFTSGREALAAMQHHHPEVLLSDVRMPDMDGIELMTEAAAITPLCERIMITGFADTQAVIQAINKGHVHYFLEKPWDSVRLRNVVLKGVELTRTRRRNLHLEAILNIQNAQLTQMNASLEARVKARTKMLMQANESTLAGFSSLIELRFDGAEGQRQLLASLLENMSASFGLKTEAKRALLIAGQLRNLGKIALPDSLINKPYKELSQREKEKFEQHPFIAMSTLALIPTLKSSANIIAHYMETMDGRGYPKRTEPPPLLAQLLGAASWFTDKVFGLIDGHTIEPNLLQIKIQPLLAGRYSTEVINALDQAVSALAAQKPIAFHERLPVAALQPGMRLSEDLLSPYGSLLLAKGVELQGELIENLHQLEANTGLSLSLRVEKIDLPI